jgi:hypothetical protein
MPLVATLASLYHDNLTSNIVNNKNDGVELYL